MQTETASGDVGSVMELLRSGVSLSLLLDLATPCGPPSAELYAAELVSA